MADLEKVNHTVIRRQEADTRRTEDAAEKTNVMVEDAVWDTGATGVAAELNLWHKMN